MRREETAVAMNNTRKGFAYRLGLGLGSAVAGVRSLERRALASANAKSASVGLLTKLVVLAIKLGMIVALTAALISLFSWLVTSVLMVGLVILASRLLKGVEVGEDYAPIGYSADGRRLDSYGAPTDNY